MRVHLSLCPLSGRTRVVFSSQSAKADLPNSLMILRNHQRMVVSCLKEALTEWHDIRHLSPTKKCGSRWLMTNVVSFCTSRLKHGYEDIAAAYSRVSDLGARFQYRSTLFELEPHWAGSRAIQPALSWSNSSGQVLPSQIPACFSLPHSNLLINKQAVGWAKEQGIYVILDMHQDQYSRFIFGDKTFEVHPYLQAQDGQDGAPEWAVITDGWPAVALYGISPLNLASMAAFDNFYMNSIIPGIPQGDAPGPGLQDHFIGAMAFIAKRLQSIYL